ncbi:MAG: hypothetical protein EOP64_00015 [Sphingomonas sp.]|nr:MAG: hypothetical protein EOP64_00015 [Sphingomonas sp.]
MRLFGFAHLLAGLLMCLPPSSGRAAITNLLTPVETGVSGSNLSQAPKISLRVSGYTAASIYVFLNRVAASAVNMVCTSGPTVAIQAPVSVAQVNGTSGVITMAPASWTYPVSSSGMLRMLVSPVNDTFLICTFSGPQASSDTISVYAQLGGY